MLLPTLTVLLQASADAESLKLGNLLGVMEPLLPVAASLLLLVVSLIALAYAIGSLLANEQLKAWARMELTEVFYSAVILVMAIAIFTAANDSLKTLIDSYHPYIDGQTVYPSGYCSHLETFRDYQHLPCHLGVAKGFFSTLFDQSSMYLYTMLRQYNRFAYLASVSLNIETIVHSVGSLSFSPFIGYLQLPMSVYNYLFDFGVRSLILIKFQEIAVEFTNSSIFPVFFVVGTLLRTFPAMRRLGGLMMAIGISFYYVFPIFYGLGSYVITNMMIEQLDATGSINFIQAPFIDFDSIQSGTGTPLVSYFTPEIDAEAYSREELSSGEYLYPYLDPTRTDICTPPEDAHSGFDALDEWSEFVTLFAELVAFPISGFLWGEQFDEWIMGDFGVVNSMARVVFFSLFFSFLSIMSTIAAIKSLSPLLGGDVEIAGLTHLV